MNRICRLFNAFRTMLKREVNLPKLLLHYIKYRNISVQVCRGATFIIDKGATIRGGGGSSLAQDFVKGRSCAPT